MDKESSDGFGTGFGIDYSVGKDILFQFTYLGSIEPDITVKHVSEDCYYTNYYADDIKLCPGTDVVVSKPDFRMVYINCSGIEQVICYLNSMPLKI